jgi:hypothetical protein
LKAGFQEGTTPAKTGRMRAPAETPDARRPVWHMGHRALSPPPLLPNETPKNLARTEVEEQQVGQVLAAVVAAGNEEVRPDLRCGV